jgi:hypothetical protein
MKTYTIQCGDKQLTELAQAMLRAVVPDEGRSAAEQVYGDYMNAVVTYFPYQRSHECQAESLDDTIGRFLNDEGCLGRVQDAVENWMYEQDEAEAQ